MPAASIRFRLILALLLIIGAGGAVGAVAHLRLAGDTSVLKERSARLLELIGLGHELDEVIGEQHSAVLSYLLTGEPGKTAAYHAARIDEAKLIGASDAIVVGHVELLVALNDLERATEDWRAKFADPSIGLVQTGQGDAARAPGRIGNGEALYGTVVAADVAFDGRVGALNTANADEIDRIEQDQFTAETIIDLSPGHRDQITVSVGVAAWPGDATDQTKLLEVADAALYRAKNAGRNQVVVAGEAFRPRLGLPADDAETAPVLGGLAAG